MKDIKGWKVSFSVPASKLSLILGLLENEVSDIKMEQTELQVPVVRHFKSRQMAAPGGLKINDIVLAACAVGKTIEYRQIQEKLSAKGFAATSASPTMAKLTKKGFFKLAGPRLYLRTDKLAEKIEA